MTDFTWSPEQEKVILADVEARLLIDAGPGTGKTEVLCARVASMIDADQIDANEILVLSFTNAAVHELRQRMRSFVEDQNSLEGLRITTIDSFGALIRIGFAYGDTAFEDYSKAIEDFATTVRNDPRVAEHISNYRHIFVDEAQDVVSPRLQLILDILSVIPETTGVTIMSDEAQAIYGFAEEGSSNLEPGFTLPMGIRKFFPNQFVSLKLNKIHRTGDTRLKKLYKDGRKILLDEAGLSESQYNEIRNLILDICHEQIASVAKRIENDQIQEENEFWLFRKRGEALQTSSELANSNPFPSQHRLRMSEFPKVVKPWVALCLWDYQREDLSKANFLEIAEQKEISDLEDVEQIWHEMWLQSGISKTKISVSRLANALSRPTPPVAFTTPDFGNSGPVIGTIHGSKGRETETVCLYLPKVAKMEEMTPEEILSEARLLYVGATRAKNSLFVNESSRRPAFNLKNSGRAFAKNFSRNSKSALMEIGRNGDVLATGLVGTKYFESAEHAEEAQYLVLSLYESTTLLQADMDSRAERESDAYFSYAVRILNNDRVDATSIPAFYLSKQVKNELYNVATALRWTNYRPNGYLRMHSLGLRTMAISADDEIRNHLHSPWRESGFIFAPLVVGYSNCFFNYRNSSFNRSAWRG